ncbi:hypothetical protein [Kibdelosporangium phytohabitans]|uniref:Uncharacterized protein n=1 Tax=Kibdelosporangium phytohabitans TaxID=860235 RepID=A0A0N9HM70_9PSEU|nr:hypothetical protein [Kibdelosporangium phytohabitans]ALG07641.1 hypothetical protein AOZ06_12640 [Kibdelosporangium phytohabitans]ALG07697.1 hypothetical protein AOZ06_12960 [Kibdelosporangium phytohabitans]MBE1471405.1 hypothetical protein [Kibdelosporangium phytohabitans]
MSTQKITAAFSIAAGGYGEIILDTTGLSADEIAEQVFVNTVVDTTLCHECAHTLSDPEVEDLTGFTIDGVHYGKRDGHWQVAR